MTSRKVSSYSVSLNGKSIANMDTDSHLVCTVIVNYVKGKGHRAKNADSFVTVGYMASDMSQKILIPPMDSPVRPGDIITIVVK